MVSLQRIAAVSRADSQAAKIARTVAGPATAFVTSALPLFPPTAQLIGLGVISAVPFFRLCSVIKWRVFKHASDRPPLADNTLTAQLNKIAGEAERVMESGRVLGTTIGFGGALFVSPETAPFAAIAAASSWLGLLEHYGHVEPQLVDNQQHPHNILSPKGFERQEARALGPLGPFAPEQFPKEDLKQMMLTESFPSTRSRLPHWRVLLMTVFKIYGIVLRALYRVGDFNFRELLEGLKDPHSIKPGRERFLKAMDGLLPYWSGTMREIYGMSLRQEGFDQLKPENTLRVHCVVPHTNLWPNFGISFEQSPRSRPFADSSNFLKDPAMQKFGITYLCMKMLNPFARRRSHNGDTESSNQDSYDKATDWMIHNKIEPVVYATGGRVPRAWTDDGRLSYAGLYSNVLKVAKPERCLNFEGTMSLALAAAKKAGKPVAICIESIDESFSISPKQQKKPPFHRETVRRGAQVTHRLSEVIMVNEGDDRDTLRNKLHEACKKATNINERLAQTMRNEWGRVWGERIVTNFQTLANADERLYIIADRIRSIHPSVRLETAPRTRFASLKGGDQTSRSKIYKRDHFKARLADLLEKVFLTQTTSPDIGDKNSEYNKTVSALLQEISETVSETQYQEFHEPKESRKAAA